MVTSIQLFPTVIALTPWDQPVAECIYLCIPSLGIATEWAWGLRDPTPP